MICDWIGLEIYLTFFNSFFRGFKDACTNNSFCFINLALLVGDDELLRIQFTLLLLSLMFIKLTF